MLYGLSYFYIHAIAILCWQVIHNFLSTRVFKNNVSQSIFGQSGSRLWRNTQRCSNNGRQLSRTTRPPEPAIAPLPVSHKTNSNYFFLLSFIAAHISTSKFLASCISLVRLSTAVMTSLCDCSTESVRILLPGFLETPPPLFGSSCTVSPSSLATAKLCMASEKGTKTLNATGSRQRLNLPLQL